MQPQSRVVPQYNKMQIENKREIDRDIAIEAQRYNQKSLENIQRESQKLSKENVQYDVFANKRSGDVNDSQGNVSQDNDKVNDFLTKNQKPAFVLFQDDFRKEQAGYLGAEDLMEDEENVSRSIQANKSKVKSKNDSRDQSSLQSDNLKNKNIESKQEKLVKDYSIDVKANYFIQIGSFQKFSNAINLEKKAKDAGELALVSTLDKNGKWYRVLIGPLKYNEIPLAKQRVKDKLDITKMLVVKD